MANTFALESEAYDIGKIIPTNYYSTDYIIYSKAVTCGCTIDGSYENNEFVLTKDLYKLKDYIIQFDANGGSGSVPETMTVSGKSADTVTMGDIKMTYPTKTGYTFRGWSASSEYSEKRIAHNSDAVVGGAADSNGVKAEITHSYWTYQNYCDYTGGNSSNTTLTLYAQWEEKNKVNVTGNITNGTFTLTLSAYVEDTIASGTKLGTITPDDDYDLPTSVTLSTGSAKIDSSGNVILLNAITAPATITVTAECPDAKYKVTLKITNGGTSSDSVLYIKQGGTATWTVYANEGYILPEGYYNYVENGSLSGTTVTSIEVTKELTVTLTCVQLVTIIFDGNGADGGSLPYQYLSGNPVGTFTFVNESATFANVGSTFYTTSESPAAQVPTRTGYNFKGWGATKEFSSKYRITMSGTDGTADKTGRLATAVSYTWKYGTLLDNVGTTDNDTHTLTLYAQWEGDSYINFLYYYKNTDDEVSGMPGTQVSGQDEWYEYGYVYYPDTLWETTVNSTTTITRSGYTFLAWGDSSSLNTCTTRYYPGDSIVIGDSNKEVNQSKQLYAYWSRDSGACTVYDQSATYTGETLTFDLFTDADTVNYTYTLVPEKYEGTVVPYSDITYYYTKGETSGVLKLSSDVLPGTYKFNVVSTDVRGQESKEYHHFYITINKKSNTITWDDIGDKLLNSDIVAVDISPATSLSGETITYESSNDEVILSIGSTDGTLELTVSDSLIAGSYLVTFTATDLGNDIYESVSTSLTITITVTLNSEDLADSYNITVTINLDAWLVGQTYSVYFFEEPLDNIGDYSKYEGYAILSEANNTINYEYEGISRTVYIVDPDDPTHPSETTVIGSGTVTYGDNDTIIDTDTDIAL